MRSKSSVLLLTLFLAACVSNPTAQAPTKDDLILPGFEDLLPDGPTSVIDDILPDLPPIDEEDFKTALSKLGIQLKPSEIAQIEALIEIVPNGKWGRAASRSESESLQANFERFGGLFVPSVNSAEAYRQRAFTFSQKSSVPYYLDLQYYYDSQKFLVIKWDERTGEFIVIQPDGSMVNYLISTAVSAPRYIRINL